MFRDFGDTFRNPWVHMFGGFQITTSTSTSAQPCPTSSSSQETLLPHQFLPATQTTPTRSAIRPSPHHSFRKLPRSRKNVFCRPSHVSITKNDLWRTTNSLEFPKRFFRNRVSARTGILHLGFFQMWVSLDIAFMCRLRDNQNRKFESSTAEKFPWNIQNIAIEMGLF